MVLSEDAWRELRELGVLEEDETCAGQGCPRRAVLRAPARCVTPAREVRTKLPNDLDHLAVERVEQLNRA
jgi:hypothetical protein